MSFCQTLIDLCEDVIVEKKTPLRQQYMFCLFDYAVMVCAGSLCLCNQYVILLNMHKEIILVHAY